MDNSNEKKNISKKDTDKTKTIIVSVIALFIIFVCFFYDSIPTVYGKIEMQKKGSKSA